MSCLLLVCCRQAPQDKPNDDHRDKGRQEQVDNKEDDNKDYIVPQWGSRFYRVHNGKIEAIEHIWLRHNYNSTYDNVSRFAKTYSTRQDIKQLITEALKQAKKNEIQKEPAGDKSVTTTMDKPTGLNLKGKPTRQIRIFLDKKNFVKTAYPQ